MSRARSVVPKYRKHPNGSAFVCHASIPNKSHRKYLGKFGSEQSKKRYRAFLARLDAGRSSAEPTDSPDIDELILAYLDHAKDYYQRDGEMSPEYDLMIYALKPLGELYGTEQAATFGPLALGNVVAALVRRGWARSNINHNLSRIKRFFRWACSQELAPPELYHKLLTVKGLARGQSGCREANPVRPADAVSVKGVLPYLSPTLAAMVQVQQLCGMRPGEVCIMRAEDIDRTGDVWLFRPMRHKTAWRGFSQVKAIPGSAQKLLRPYLSNAPWLFPAASRRLKVPRPYSTASYRRAVTRAIERAKEKGVKVVSFTPNRLRHMIANEVAQLLGQQAAQRWIGHANLNTTNLYTEAQISELIVIAKALEAEWRAG